MIYTIRCVEINIFVFQWNGYTDLTTIVGAANEAFDALLEVLFIESRYLCEGQTGISKRECLQNTYHPTQTKNFQLSG